ncbi:hypothetical protein TSAR_000840 [Trichomalopsis sarcophagae]|uniref:Uncharacterized protein n=1 Tax=Trichomalopsis sarcophagae TaxID=543379 RepID=A0A232EVZ6_9HYME|nr:hypothetical protein TSAR_000840 [Trichomalopsis sarcophagae]
MVVVVVVMRIAEQQQVVMVPLYNQAEEGIHSALLRIALRLSNESVLIRRRCNLFWRRRVRRMGAVELKREFWKLLRCCGPRKISVLYSTVFRKSTFAVRCAAEFAIGENINHLPVLQRMLDSYEENNAFNRLLTDINCDEEEEDNENEEEEEDNVDAMELASDEGVFLSENGEQQQQQPEKQQQQQLVHPQQAEPADANVQQQQPPEDQQAAYVQAPAVDEAAEEQAQMDAEIEEEEEEEEDNSTIGSASYAADESDIATQIGGGINESSTIDSSDGNVIEEEEEPETDEEEEESINGEGEEDETAEEEESHRDDEEMDVKQNEDIRPPGERFIIHGHETHYVAKYRLNGRRLLLKIRSPPRKILILSFG